MLRCTSGMCAATCVPSMLRCGMDQLDTPARDVRRRAYQDGRLDSDDRAGLGVDISFCLQKNCCVQGQFIGHRKSCFGHDANSGRPGKRATSGGGSELDVEYQPSACKWIKTDFGHEDLSTQTGWPRSEPVSENGSDFDSISTDEDVDRDAEMCEDDTFTSTFFQNHTLPTMASLCPPPMSSLSPTPMSSLSPTLMTSLSPTPMTSLSSMSMTSLTLPRMTSLSPTPMNSLPPHGRNKSLLYSLLEPLGPSDVSEQDSGVSSSPPRRHFALPEVKLLTRVGPSDHEQHSVKLKQRHSVVAPRAIQTHPGSFHCRDLLPSVVGTQSGRCVATGLSRPEVINVANGHVPSRSSLPLFSSSSQSTPSSVLSFCSSPSASKSSSKDLVLFKNTSSSKGQRRAKGDLQASLRHKEGRMLLKAAKGFLIYVSQDLTILFVSDNVCDHLGFSQLEMLGRSVSEFIDPRDVKKLQQHLGEGSLVKDSCDANSRTTKQRFHLGMKFAHKALDRRSKKSGYLPVEWHAKRETSHVTGSGSQGKQRIVGLVSLCVPDRSEVIMDMRMESNMFNSRHDLSFHFLSCDARSVHLLGYDPVDLIGRVAYHFHHPTDISVCVKCHHKLLESGKSTSGYYRFLARTGSVVWMVTEATVVVCGSKNRPNYITCKNYVVSEKEAKRGLLHQKIRLDQTELMGFSLDTELPVAGSQSRHVSAGSESDGQRGRPSEKELQLKNGFEHKMAAVSKSGTSPRSLDKRVIPDPNLFSSQGGEFNDTDVALCYPAESAGSDMNGLGVSSGCSTSDWPREEALAQGAGQPGEEPDTLEHFFGIEPDPPPTLCQGQGDFFNAIVTSSQPVHHDVVSSGSSCVSMAHVLQNPSFGDPFCLDGTADVIAFSTSDASPPACLGTDVISFSTSYEAPQTSLGNDVISFTTNSMTSNIGFERNSSLEDLLLGGSPVFSAMHTHVSAPKHISENHSPKLSTPPPAQLPSSVVFHLDSKLSRQGDNVSFGDDIQHNVIHQTNSNLMVNDPECSFTEWNFSSFEPQVKIPTSSESNLQPPRSPSSVEVNFLNNPQSVESISENDYSHEPSSPVSEIQHVMFSDSTTSELQESNPTFCVNMDSVAMDYAGDNVDSESLRVPASSGDGDVFYEVLTDAESDPFLGFTSQEVLVFPKPLEGGEAVSVHSIATGFSLPVSTADDYASSCVANILMPDMAMETDVQCGNGIQEGDLKLKFEAERNEPVMSPGEHVQTSRSPVTPFHHAAATDSTEDVGAQQANAKYFESPPPPTGHPSLLRSLLDEEGLAQDKQTPFSKWATGNVNPCLSRHNEKPKPVQTSRKNANSPPMKTKELPLPTSSSKKPFRNSQGLPKPTKELPVPSSFRQQQPSPTKVTSPQTSSVDAASRLGDSLPEELVDLVMDYCGDSKASGRGTSCVISELTRALEWESQLDAFISATSPSDNSETSSRPPSSFETTDNAEEDRSSTSRTPDSDLSKSQSSNSSSSSLPSILSDVLRKAWSDQSATLSEKNTHEKSTASSCKISLLREAITSPNVDKLIEQIPLGRRLLQGKQSASQNNDVSSRRKHSATSATLNVKDSFSNTINHPYISIREMFCSNSLDGVELGHSPDHSASSSSSSPAPHSSSSNNNNLASNSQPKRFQCHNKPTSPQSKSSPSGSKSPGQSNSPNSTSEPVSVMLMRRESRSRRNKPVSIQTQTENSPDEVYPELEFSPSDVILTPSVYVAKPPRTLPLPSPNSSKVACFASAFQSSVKSPNAASPSLVNEWSKSQQTSTGETSPTGPKISELERCLRGHANPDRSHSSGGAAYKRPEVTEQDDIALKNSAIPFLQRLLTGELSKDNYQKLDQQLMEQEMSSAE